MDCDMDHVEKVSGAKVKGVVKWFSDAKGYGFICAHDGGEYFAHYSEVVGEGFKSLAQNSRVDFIPKNSAKGLVASEISVI